tara:strand:+ start:138 stop:920 length:783 start_codon:yes stop_codon:yes gene_type:complete
MDRFIYIRNAEDDAYMNKVSNFKGITQTGSAAVTLLFEAAQGAAGNNAGFDEIILAVTANKEKEAMFAIGGALAGSKSGSTAVIADEYGNVFCDDTITAVTSITKNTAGNALTKIEAFTPAGDGTGAGDNANTKQLEASDSGKTFLINMSANTAAFRLPAVSGNSGVNYGFIMDVTSDGEDTKDFILSTDANAENIMGVVQDAGAIHDIPPTTSVITLDASAGNVGAGDRLFCVCDGTNWYITEANALSANAWVPADNAI